MALEELLKLSKEELKIIAKSEHIRLYTKKRERMAERIAETMKLREERGNGFWNHLSS